MSKPSTPKISVRNLSPDIYEILKKESEKNCRSLEGEVRFALSLYVDCLKDFKKADIDINQKIFKGVLELKEALSRLTDKKDTR